MSTGTVDRVLHNRGEVSDDTKNKILSIVNELNYEPNYAARSLAIKKSFILKIVIPEHPNTNPYWHKPFLGIVNAAHQLQDYNVSLDFEFFDINNQDSFNKVIDKVKISDTDGIVFAPIFYTSANELFTVCNNRNIPVVLIDSYIDNNEVVAYFGQDAYQSGLATARLLSYSLSNDAKVLIVRLYKKEGNINHLIKRTEGFSDFFKMNSSESNKKILILDIDHTNQSEIDFKLNNALNNNNIEGIYVTNSKVYKIAEFLEKNHFQKIRLIGYDLIDENVTYLNKEIIDFLIAQKPELQGYKSVITLYNHLINKKIAKRINFSPIDIITKENINYYLNYEE